MLEQPLQHAFPRQVLLWPLRIVSVLALCICLWLASGLAVPSGLLSLSHSMQTIVTVFLGIFIEALPFLLAGVLASSAIHLFVSAETIQRMSPSNPILAALAGSLMGLLFPVCECGSIPTTRRLLAKGTPMPLGTAFVLAAPVVNPIVILSTWVAFSGQPWIVLGRIGLTILIATVVGLVLGVHPRPQELLAITAGHTRGPECQHDHEHDHSFSAGESRFRAVLSHASAEFFEMGRYLVIGGLIAAILQTIIPRSALLEFGQGPLISALVLMGLAVVLSICSTVDAFVALSFAQNFMPGAVLAFLVFGPMIDLKSILMFRTTFRRRTVALIVLLTFQMTLLAAVLINLYL